MPTITPKQVLRISDLATIQPDAIVSRQVIHQHSGNLTFFAFDKGQQLSEHTAPFDALIHILEGKAQITIDGEGFTLQAGEIILMPANHPHAVRALEPSKLLLIMFKSP